MKKLTITSYHKKRVEYDIEYNDMVEGHYLNGRNKLENVFNTTATIRIDGIKFNTANYYSNTYTTTGSSYWTGNTSNTIATINISSLYNGTYA